MIEDAYTLGGQLGLDVWCLDQAGPYQAVPHAGQRWRPECDPARQPHEYVRGGTAKILTLFHPADGRVRVEGATSCTNAVLHPWIKRQLTEVLSALPAPPGVPSDDEALRAAWGRWQEGLTVKFTLPRLLPPLRLLLVLDNLTGHKTPELVLWLISQGVMPLYTPISGSWLNMAESIQGVLKPRALAGSHPACPDEIIRRFEEVAGHWNKDPTPFEWAGKRAARRKRQRGRRHKVGGSGAEARRPVQRTPSADYGQKQRK